MRLVFDNQAFSFQLLRVIGHTPYNGADIGECISTAYRIKDGDLESWHAEWLKTADRIRAIAEKSSASRNVISAREAFLRASNYYRAAEFFLHVDPGDPRISSTWHASRDCFASAAKLFSPPIEAVEIQYENTTLPGYFYRADDSLTPRPTLIFHGGFDSIVEELHFAGAAAAVRRGFNCLTFDGPGQGRVIREQRIPFRSDWEKVVMPVVDYALTRPEVDAERIALMGMSLGGFLAGRAAAFEHRLAALILFNGIYDLYDNATLQIPRLLRPLLGRQNSRLANSVLQVSARLGMRRDIAMRWALTQAMWAGGFDSPVEYFQRSRQQFTMKGIVNEIGCPTLVCDAECDHAFHDARAVYEALNCPKRYVLFSSEEGAEEHCQVGAMSLCHQRVFDWLDDIIGRPVVRQLEQADPATCPCVK